MKTKNLFLLPALIVLLNLPVAQAPAQTFTSLGNLHDNPISFGNTLYASLHGLALSGNTFYGTVPGDVETDYSGAVYAVSTGGTGFTDVYSFAPISLYVAPYINPGGAFPNPGLFLSGTTLYGTTYWGGSAGRGTVFGVSTNGTRFTVLHNFTGGSDGSHLQTAFILSGNTLYGATGGEYGGPGEVFAVNTNGTGFTVLHNFAGGNDGSNPQAGFILLGNTLYGTAYQSGSGGGGTVFAVKTNGTGFTVLHNFTGGSDGSNPQAGLIFSGNTLYGTTPVSVFAVNTNGTGYANLHSFTALSTNSSGIYTNSDGAGPQARLILLGNTLYGTAYQGGTLGYGTVFALSTNGTGFTNLHSFTGSSDGANPGTGLILSGNTFYGATTRGGSSGEGTVFSLSFAPQVTITPFGTNVILVWPTNVAGFDSTGYTLQSTASLVSSAVWSTNSPAPVVIAGLNTVTNPIAGDQHFYRLIQ